MGVDKAGLEVRGRTLLAGAVEVLTALTPRVVLASGGTSRYAELGHEEVLDRVADAGPLAGLEAGLAAARAGQAKPLHAADDVPPRLSHPALEPRPKALAG